MSTLNIFRTQTKPVRKFLWPRTHTVNIT